MPFYIFKKICFILDVFGFCPYVWSLYVCLVPLEVRREKSLWDPMGLELQTAWRHHVCTGNWTQVLWSSNRCPYTLSHLSSPLFSILMTHWVQSIFFKFFISYILFFCQIYSCERFSSPEYNRLLNWSWGRQRGSHPLLLTGLEAALSGIRSRPTPV